MSTFRVEHQNPKSGEWSLVNPKTSGMSAADAMECARIAEATEKAYEYPGIPLWPIRIVNEQTGHGVPRLGVGGSVRFRIEVRHPICGWRTLRNEAALTRPAAEKVLKHEREHESYYARFGARPARLRMVNEKTGEVVA